MQLLLKGRNALIRSPYERKSDLETPWIEREEMAYGKSNKRPRESASATEAAAGRKAREETQQQARSLSDHAMTTIFIEDEEGAANRLSEKVAAVERAAGRPLSIQ